MSQSKSYQLTAYNITCNSIQRYLPTKSVKERQDGLNVNIL